MKFLCIVCCLIGFAAASYSQRMDVFNKDTSLKNIKDSYRINNSAIYQTPSDGYVWALLDSSTDDRTLKFLATIRITEKKSDGIILYYLDGNLNTLSKKLGANLLKLKNFSYDKKSNLFYITLDAFLAPAGIFALVRNRKPGNVLYLLPYWKTEKDSTRFTLNGRTVKIGYRECLTYDIRENETVTFFKSIIDQMEHVEWGMNRASTYVIATGWGPTTQSFYLREGFGELLTKTIFNKPINFQR